MNIVFWALVICSQAATIAAKLLVRNHTCLPSGYSTICILESLHYQPSEENSVVHHFPANQTHIRIISEARSTRYHSRPVLDVDAKLHELLGRPRILEIYDLVVRNLQIPRALHHGSFRNLYTRNLTLEPGTDIPSLVFLDLTNNYLRNISVIRGLLNLEVLYLGDNLFSSIDPNTMKDLTKLRYLDLSFNDLSKVSLNIFPQSITHLDLHITGISSLDYNDLSYPSLEVLNVERNDLTLIDGPALLLAMPRLKLARIGGNELDRDDLLLLLDFFQRHNISLGGAADEAACWTSEEFLGGVCLSTESVRGSRSAFWDVLLSLVVILVACALLAALRWVFRAMNGK